LLNEEKIFSLSYLLKKTDNMTPILNESNRKSTSPSRFHHSICLIIGIISSCSLSLKAQLSGLYQVKLAASGLVLDAQVTSNDGKVRLWQSPVGRGKAVGVGSQTWTFVNVGGNNYKILAGTSQFALDADGGTYKNNGGIVHLWESNGGFTQIWTVVPLGGDKYHISLAKNGKGLDADADNIAKNDCLVQLWDKKTSSPTQIWSIGSLKVAPPPPPPLPPPPPPPSLTQNWGGGEDYSNFVYKYTKLVNTKDELINALNTAKTGEVIYVDDNAEIDLTGVHDLSLNEGVTLASGRGKNGSLGALLYCTNIDSYNLFHITTNNTRITGLRLRGPDPYEEPPLTPQQRAMLQNKQFPLSKDQIKLLLGPLLGNPGCIRIGTDGYFNEDQMGNINDILKLNVEIDNNDIGAWPAYCVSVYGVMGIAVRYNNLHNNLRDFLNHGAGYGVDVGIGHVLVEKNIFSYNRHDIASNGHPFSSYTFRNNLVLQGGTHHSIDVHGWRESIGDKKRPDGHCFAGNTFIVEGNVVLEDFNWFKSTFWAYNMLIRGIPDVGVYVRNNQFAQHQGVTIGQTPDGGIDITNRIANVFESNPSLSKIFIEPNNQFKVNYPNALFITHGGAGYWTFRRFEDKSLSKMVTGDFNGDGKADLFYIDGQNWLISDRAKLDFRQVNRFGMSLNDLRFGDFDGDGKTDVFRKNGDNWEVSKGAASAWFPLNSSSANLSDLLFGDFNGDKQIDVLWVHDGKWMVSWSGQSAWATLNTAGMPINSLGVGDFNGDGKDDMFKTEDGRWYVSWSGASRWEKINSSPYTVMNTRFGDFNGDKKTDIFKTEGGEWFVSWSGTSQWIKINSSPYTINDFVFGDFNGDKKTDIMVSFNDWR
jgi:hypothetical protein